MKPLPHNLAMAFANAVGRGPQRVALRCEDGETLTYAELDVLSNQLARWLLRLGTVPGDVIALMQDKTPLGYAAMLGCIKIGAVYVNLDDGNPPERLAGIWETARPKRLICVDGVRPERCPPGVEQLILDLNVGADSPWRTELPDPLPNCDETTGTQPAYLMYTSGSTGIPKGAVIPHGAVLRFIDWIRTRFAVGTQDVFSGLNPPYFDNSVFDFYGGLFCGASLAPFRRKTTKDAHRLIQQVERAGCTIWFSVPSLLVYAHTLKALQPDRLSSVRQMAFGGEGFPKSVLAQLHADYAHRIRLVNVYGPTECTCICSAHDVVAEDFRSAQGLAPLGRLNPDFTGLILDHDLKPVAPGDTGELWLGGPNVGLGYYNDPERTALAFRQNPTHSRYPDVFYRTGDLVRCNEQGLLEFIGRKDNQVKHLGYRIELEEIEAALCRLPYVTQAGVVYRRLREEFGQIEAYVSVKPQGKVAESSLRHDLHGMVPDYMLPRRFVVLEQLPKNANGKVDRKALLNLGT